MKIAVSVEFISNGARVSKLFGKSEYFFIYDMDSETLIQKMTNHISNSHGSEVFCAQMLIKQGVNVVVCGICENDAKKLFSEATIKVIENVEASPAMFMDELYGMYREQEQVHSRQFGQVGS
ncbi:MAG: NifB/NifX family molybdenum-iron cluster-binding protein [Ignavibacteriaceae bacterium]